MCVCAFVHHQFYLGANAHERYVTCTHYKKGAIPCANWNTYTGMSHNAKRQTFYMKLQSKYSRLWTIKYRSCHVGCCELSSSGCLLQFQDSDAADVYQALRLVVWLVMDIGCLLHYNNLSSNIPWFLSLALLSVQFNSICLVVVKDISLRSSSRSQRR